MKRSHALLGLVLPTLAVLAHCGGKKSESGKVTFEMVPDKPIVITADTTVNQIAIPKPWFKFSVNVTNGSEKPVTIVAMTAIITAPGAFDTTGWAEDPASQAQTLSTGTSSAIVSSVSCTYTTYGTWGPNEVKPIGLPSPVDACNIPSHPFYIGGLKDSSNGSYRYKVQLKPIGWFGTETAPTDRFDGSVTFYTQ